MTNERGPRPPEATPARAETGAETSLCPVTLRWVAAMLRHEAKLWPNPHHEQYETGTQHGLVSGARFVERTAASVDQRPTSGWIVEPIESGAVNVYAPGGVACVATAHPGTAIDPARLASVIAAVAPSVDPASLTNEEPANG